MSNDKLKQLIETLSSIGYNITKLNCYHTYNIEILLLPSFRKKLMSNIKFIQLIETLSSIGFKMTEYNLLCEHARGKIKISLQLL